MSDPDDPELDDPEFDRWRVRALREFGQQIRRLATRTAEAESQDETPAESGLGERTSDPPTPSADSATPPTV